MIDKAIDDYIKGLKEEYNTLEKFIPIVVNLTSRVYFLSTRIFLKNYSSSNH